MPSSGQSMSEAEVHNQVKGVTASATSPASSGDNTLKSVTAGKLLRAYYLCLSADGGNTNEVKCIIKFSAGGSSEYVVSLKPGVIWARAIKSGNGYIQGAASEALILNLSANETVHASVETEEIVNHGG